MLCICQTNEVKSNGHFVHQPVQALRRGRGLEEVTNRNKMAANQSCFFVTNVIINILQMYRKYTNLCWLYELVISVLMFKTHADLKSIPFGTFNRPHKGEPLLGVLYFRILHISGLKILVTFQLKQKNPRWHKFIVLAEKSSVVWPATSCHNRPKR